jgi:hypothetical protein
LSFALKAPAGLNAIKVTVDVYLQEYCRVIGGPAGCSGSNIFKIQLAKIKFIDKDIDHSHRVGIRNIVVEKFRQQNSLSSILALNETLHKSAPNVCPDTTIKACRDICVYIEHYVFTQSGPKGVIRGVKSEIT